MSEEETAFCQGGLLNGKRYELVSQFSSVLDRRVIRREVTMNGLNDLNERPRRWYSNPDWYENHWWIPWIIAGCADAISLAALLIVL